MQASDEEHNRIRRLDADRMTELSARGELPEPAVVDAETDRPDLRWRSAECFEHAGFVAGLRDQHPCLPHQPWCVVDRVVSESIRLANADAWSKAPQRRPDDRHAMLTGGRKGPACVSASRFGDMNQIEVGDRVRVSAVPGLRIEAHPGAWLAR